MITSSLYSAIRSSTNCVAIGSSLVSLVNTYKWSELAMKSVECGIIYINIATMLVLRFEKYVQLTIFIWISFYWVYVHLETDTRINLTSFDNG